MNKRFFAGHEIALLILLLSIVSALVYLPRIDQIGYMNDDWYLMYSAKTYGPDSFVDIYSIDRPARALVMIPAYNLFGDNPLYYNLSAYLLRLISGISFFWLLQMLWPRQRSAGFVAALLFLVYPGFLSQANGIDYQSQMVSLAAGILSVALSVKVSLVRYPFWRWTALLFAIPLGWLYLGLVEYFIGFELMRLGSFYLLARRERNSFGGRLLLGIRRWLPSSIIPIAFLVWRVFLFESERGATDIGSQFDQFMELPLATGVRWLVALGTDSLETTFFAWGIPFYQFIGYISRLRDYFIGGVSAIVIIVLVLWSARRLDRQDASESTEPGDWQAEVLWFGVIVVLAGLLPVILVNRGVDFSGFSRYALAGSAGSALILASILYFLPSQFIRWALTSLLLTISVFTHHANTIRLANNTASLRSFWWQVAWRVPQFEPGTTLVANYPLAAIEEDYFVWGPASMIYYPEPNDEQKITPALSAAVLNRYSMLKILSDGNPDFINRRLIRSVIDYQNIVILTKPYAGSCVQVLDGNAPLLSQFEQNDIMIIASHSDAANIVLGAESHIPPEVVFGPEPAQEWCYYFEKADLARQRGDWDTVRDLGDRALKKDFAASDPIEWVPFLQAYARAGNADAMKDIDRAMGNADPFVRRQICESLRTIPDLSTAVLDTTDALFCSQ